MGAVEKGKDKWLGGCLGPDGLVYCIPGSAKTVLRVDPLTGASEAVGTLRGTQEKRRGAAAAPSALVESSLRPVGCTPR